VTRGGRRLGSLAERPSREAGYAAILTAVLVASGFLFACAAISVDTSRWYDEQARIQKAADAAALAGVPFLPQDPASAFARAKEVAKRNGYDDASPDVEVKPKVGGLPGELEVTVTSRLNNTFGGLIGVSSTTVIRTAKATYNGPAPMGSPCNTFGNEPDPGNGAGSPSPKGTAQGASPYPNCPRVPQYWATVEGPETGKLQGDRYQTKGCEANSGSAPATGVDGCSGSGWGINDEYDEFGYVFAIKVLPGHVNKAVQIQLYDPVFAPVGQRCEFLTNRSNFLDDSSPVNPYTSNRDARDRYSRNGTNTAGFCPGDSFAGGGSGASPKRPVTTSFVLRQQVDSQDPTRAPVQNDTAGSPCIRQFAGLNATFSPSANVFKNDGNPDYSDEFSKYFHNWVPMCAFTPTRSGDYYLQVRTNVSLGSGSGFERSGNLAAAALTGSTTQGEGSNGFAIRAVTQPAQEKDVAVSGYQHMPIFVNASTAAPIFNLIRVLPGARGQTINFTYFDAGDAAAAGEVRVLPPLDATGSITTTPFPGNCRATGGSAGSGEVLTNCIAPFEKNSDGTSKNNGKSETISIPIPADYTCNFSTFGGCWYRVQIGFGTGSVNDVTTWNAEIVGDPLRLIQ
jgi:Flp pilus assembly protein TadG